MAGVRGFSDPNVQVNGNLSVFHQDVDSSLSTKTNSLLPWYLPYQGGTWPDATQCMTAGSNGWSANHGSLNGDLNNKWAIKNTPYSWGYFKRADLPVHFGIAEGWTVADMYQESVIASTNPNRVSWVSGSINAPGGPQNTSQGGMYIDNSETPGCEGTNLNCYPLKWETYPEYLEAANVTWQVYQDTNNFDDNALAHFESFQKAASGSNLAKKGTAFVGLDAFYKACASGTLPAVSYIVGPAELSEHPPYQPKDGAWLQQQVVNALVKSPSYNTSALFISYDETGGWGDHVVPFHSPKDTQGEWVQDPYGDYGDVYTGPGFRLPFYIISPWTRGGNVYTENVDHSSQTKFLEKWLAAKGKNVVTQQIPAWRRANMADLTKAFDFSRPDYSIPTIPTAQTPSKDSKGNYNGYSLCESSHTSTKPKVPYGNQTEASALVSEQGFKPVRGYLTEGRYLVFEMGSYGLANAAGKPTAAAAPKHDAKAQRFVLHQSGPLSTKFTVSSAVDGKYLTSTGTYVAGTSGAASFNIVDKGNGAGYSVQSVSDGKYWTIDNNGNLVRGTTATGFKVFSVTYNN
ncbi:hypothetical protein FH972_023453 [Carpinus fangiana]|uniref:Phospholipase C n=1 Tax=Carpinus fangiana TaxID=176857 RepID=A0A5N6KVK3_9ROSI|nr:hypothetical protein FH972_023453 [Carpinus fangiana]